MADEMDERTPRGTSGNEGDDTEGQILMGGPKPKEDEDEDTEGHRMPPSKD